MLTAASRTTPRAFVASAALGSSSAQSIESQQRGYRCGPWRRQESDAEPSGRNRRRSMYRYKYMESVNGKVTWGSGSSEYSAQDAFKQAMSRFENAYGDASKAVKLAANMAGARPGRHIEDAEREPMDSLFSSKKGKSWDHDMWSSPLRNIRDYLHAVTSPFESSFAPAGPSNVGDSYIDPITNRRVHKEASEAEKSRTYQEPFTPKYDDLDDYKPTQYSKADGAGESRAASTDSAKSSDPYAAPKEHSHPKWVDTTHQVKTMKADPNTTTIDDNHFDREAGRHLDQAAQSQQDWESSHAAHKAHQEHLEKRTESADGKNYDDNSFDPTPSRYAQTDVEKGKMSWQDADASASPKVWEAPEEPHITHLEQALNAGSDGKSYDDNAFDPNPSRYTHVDPVTGEVSHKEIDASVSPKVWDTPEEAFQKHLEKTTKEDGEGKRYDDNSFDPAPTPFPQEPEQGIRFDAAAPLRDPSREAFQKQMEQATTGTTGSAGDQFHDDNGFDPVAQKAKEGPHFYNEPFEYDPMKFDPAERMYPVSSEDSSEAYKDSSLRENLSEPVEFIQEDVGASATEATSPGARFQSPRTQGQGGSVPLESTGPSHVETEPMSATQIRAKVLQKVRNNSQIHKMEQSKSAHDEMWDATVTAAKASLERSKRSKQRLTGNYTRDFPEEFTQSWSTSNSPSKTALYPSGRALSWKARAAEAEVRIQAEERDEAEPSSMDESFPVESSKLQPALDRGATRKTAKPSAESSTSLGSQAKRDEDNRGVQQTISKTFAKTSSQADTLYKVLAYDPTMQTINIAETSSTVHDQVPAATPADVLLRLTHPSKFFPHFEPLQAQGYEIASGSGDVLVFRKTRPASGLGSSGSGKQMNPINPVDMMGKPPVTGNFASPTGFVNYDDALTEPPEKPEPAFRSNIDVRREEPVFSGQKQDANTVKRPRKRSFGRKLFMGTVWTVGGMYAVGVMAEYFSTGGFDGAPRRL